MKALQSNSTLENLNKAIQTCELLEQDLKAAILSASPSVVTQLEAQLGKTKEIELRLVGIVQAAVTAILIH